MTKWYEVNAYCGHVKIEPVEVERVTDSSVWIAGRRRCRHGEYVSIFDSFDEAKAWGVAICRRRHEAAKHELDRQRQYLQRAEALKEPAE